MDLYPAVDVQGGRVARAPSPSDARPDAADPLAVVRAYTAAGARWVHFVDLDRAYARGENRDLTRRVLAAAAVPVQVGGGLVTEAAIDEVLAWGAARVVLGAAAANDDALVHRLLARHGPERVAVGLDVRAGHLAPRGGGGTAGNAPHPDVSAQSLAARLRAAGVRTVIYTDVTRDGALAGPDIAGASAIAAAGLDVIVSGGVASLADLTQVRQAPLAGAIVGRALHESRFTLAEALACLAR